MDNQVFDRVVKIVEPFAKDKAALSRVSVSSTFLKDLQVSSSRLVDIILAIEDQFNIEIADQEADKIETVGAAVELICTKQQ